MGAYIIFIAFLLLEYLKVVFFYFSRGFNLHLNYDANLEPYFMFIRLDQIFFVELLIENSKNPVKI